mmetsp:Transcript_15923/g.19433  ORF Transcript_15923/g.19433 Transcript_15923/m.19433 type:complete len:280 (-) Transcript_15923:679-1518(-)
MDSTPIAMSNRDEKSTREKMLELDGERKKLELEAREITLELERPIEGASPIGVATPLVDADGFPRNDINIYHARELRSGLNKIKTDHSIIMKQIEKYLNKSIDHKNRDMVARKDLKPKPKPIFDKKSGKWIICNQNDGVNEKDNQLSSTPRSGRKTSLKCKDINGLVISNTQTNSTETHFKSEPFAIINHVQEGSPADKGGLKMSDQIIQIGTVDSTNHRGLRAVNEVVQRSFSDKTALRFVILRKFENTDTKSKVLNLQILPYIFKNGLLGCEIKLKN